MIAPLVGFSLLIANVSPAAAIGSKASDPSDGVKTLSKSEQRSKEVSEAHPQNHEKVSSRAKDGLNSTQGSADKSKMNTPENSKDADTVIDNVENALGTSDN